MFGIFLHIPGMSLFVSIGVLSWKEEYYFQTPEFLGICLLSPSRALNTALQWSLAWDLRITYEKNF